MPDATEPPTPPSSEPIDGPENTAGGLTVYFDPFTHSIEQNNEFLAAGFEPIPIPVPRP